MPLAERDGDLIRIRTEYRDRDLIRAVPGSKWDVDDRTWTVRLSWASCKLLRGVFGDRLDVGGLLLEWAQREHDERVKPALDWRRVALNPDWWEGAFGYQTPATEFLVSAGSAVLADDMGAGKTKQVIDALEEDGAYPALVVTTNSGKSVWEEEFAKWAPDRTVTVVRGSAAKRRQQLEAEADVKVVNWEALRLHSRLAGYGSIRLEERDKQEGELNRPWAAVVADEAHRMRDPKSKQTRALWAVGWKAERRYALTGTPVGDRADELWSLLHFVSPDEWPAKSKYIDRYCQKAWNEHGGLEVLGLLPETRDEFWQVVEPRFLRRPKDLILPFLPPKVYQTRRLEMSPKQAKAYGQMVEASLAQLDGGVLSAFDPLAARTRLSQLASAYAELRDDGSVELAEPSSKVDALVELLDEMGDQQLVAFAAHRQLVELASARLERLGVAHGLITGRQDDLQRQQARADFDQGRTRCLLLTLGAGSEAITLTSASTVLFLQRSWSLIENKQAEDRLHRPGQEAQRVEVIDLVSVPPANAKYQKTIDEDQVDTLLHKAERFEEIARDREALRALLKGES